MARTNGLQNDAERTFTMLEDWCRKHKGSRIIIGMNEQGEFKAALETRLPTTERSFALVLAQLATVAHFDEESRG